MENEIVKEQKFYEVDGHAYELRYTMKSIEQIEGITKESIMNTVQNAPTLQTMKVMLGASLVNDQGNKVSLSRGMEVAETILEKYGFLPVFKDCINKMMEDCAFLFQNA